MAAKHTLMTMAACLLLAGWLIAQPVAAADCSTVTCHNGGTCNNFTVSPPCLCPLPYIAPYCQAAADYCSTQQPDKGITSLPVCLHGGNCTATLIDPYFSCSCASGYTGWRCNETVVTTAATNTTASTPTNYYETSTISAGAQAVTLNTGQIAGIAVGVIAFVLLLVAIILVTLGFKGIITPPDCCRNRVGCMPPQTRDGLNQQEDYSPRNA